MTVKISPDSTDGTNTARLLSSEEIYAGNATADQYKEEDENGNLVPTPLSNLIEISFNDISEAGQNGNPVPDEIQTVKQMMDFFCKEANVSLPQNTGVDLAGYDQITYWQDFIYQPTLSRIKAGEAVASGTSSEKLDNGMFKAEVVGGEVLRSINPDDFLIIQIDSETNEIHYLEMSEYDEESGTYVVEFPCIGPYLIAQDMHRQ